MLKEQDQHLNIATPCSDTRRRRYRDFWTIRLKLLDCYQPAVAHAMGYLSAEEITLPTRFLVMTAHCIAVLTILFDTGALTSQLLMGSSSDSVTQQQFSTTQSQLSGLAWGAMACFAIEYIGLFMGVSIFLRGHSCTYILLHFAGAILTALFYTNTWAIGAFVAFFVTFNVLPALLELLTFVFVARVNFVRY